MGIGNPAPTGGIRGEVNGWSAAAVRRHKRWLYGVDAPRLTGSGWAVTLTLRDTPATSDEWRSALHRFFERLRTHPGIVRWHWVVEWQRRGTPHLHLAVYFEEADSTPLRAWEVVDHWLAVTSGWGSRSNAQFVTPITGAVGWLQYLSKHAARGVRHYQRNGKPAGWDKTGRLWGHRGEWPTMAPVEASITQQDYWRFRRAVKAFAVADARSRALRYQACGEPRKAAVEWKRVSHLRRLLACPDRPLSTVRGVSEWCPEAVAVPLLLHSAA